MNGRGKLPERSVELQDAPNRMHDTLPNIITNFFIVWQSTCMVFSVNFYQLTKHNKTSSVTDNE